MDNQDLDAELAALVGGDNPYERWRAHPERTELEGVHAFVLYHLLATNPDDFAGEFGVSVGISRPSPNDDPELHIESVVLGIESSMGRRLNNVLLDATEARQLANQLVAAADQVREWVPPEGYMGRLARSVFPKLTVEQLMAGGLTEDEARDLHEKLREDNP
ncbi:hypothetical protein A5791_11975 [Mycobacterium sp. 852002-51163_SCH5372311]|uniref:hypothetical protein n=1 Tax=Mycobacterium sp. 852002-51163_SCH5372311 TaxID=1834097 RepID=UPI0007FD672B|nr:hypothetical protein [Mycobacterium sp. 852002-51163_SCH5372311]OBF79144.1 hypothetical protein A5791_11975 [Mycobacterium sp. 852002-51163_SCH5372311]